MVRCVLAATWLTVRGRRRLARNSLQRLDRLCRCT
jgi:hypothetical protein